MKIKINFILFLLFYCHSFLHSQECKESSGGNLTVNSQETLDQFLIDFPDCTKIAGDVYISGANDLSPLMNIDSVLGSFTIRSCPELQNLSGLENLSYIQNQLTVVLNENLEDVSAMQSLKKVGREVTGSIYNNSINIVENAKLQFIEGFASLEETELGVNIENNEILEKIEGFNALTDCHSIEIFDNPKLFTVDGFNALENIHALPINQHGDLSFSRNPELVNILGFGSLVEVSSFNLFECNALEKLDFPNNISVARDLSFYNNSVLSSIDGVLATANMWAVGFINLPKLENFDALIPLEKAERALTLEGLDLIKDLNVLSNFKRTDWLVFKNLDQIESFEGLRNLQTVEGYLIIEDNDMLQSLDGFESLDSIGSYPLANNSQLEINNNDNLHSLGGLANLKVLYQTLKIDNNDELVDISVFENVFFDRFDSATGNSPLRVRVQDNPKLKTCDYLYICNGLVQENFVLRFNDDACANDTTLMQCERFPSAKISYFLDTDENGIKDENEIDYLDSSVKIIPGDLEYFISQPMGPPLFLEEGIYDFQAQIDQNRWRVTTAQSSVEMINGEVTKVEIGIKNLVDELVLEKHARIRSRCNTGQTLFLQVLNIGTVSSSGIAWISNYPESFRPALMLEADTINNERFGWRFDQLAPSYYLRKEILVEIPGPPESEAGEHIFIQFDFEVDDPTYIDTPFLIDQVITCSWDPNDKLVSPNRNNQEILSDESLEYTIRFQNTGNDYAERVFIIDTLDRRLDFRTFDLIASSHPEKLVTTLSSDGLLKFDFPYIFLPDSLSDLTGSQGHVTFKINLDENLVAPGDIINNHADIYFDLNPPVRTNTTTSIIVDELTSGTMDDHFSNELRISPNPSGGLIYFNKAINGICTLYDLRGNQVFKKELFQQFDLQINQDLEGLYILKIEEDQLVKTFRIMFVD